ncbi:MAG: hypothetical protein IKY71_00820 [Bacteroidaceae bacterium]|nr:hypothetical protein [Bacteroidaceae bacterium]
MDILFSSAHTIRETLEKYDEWQNLVGYSDIYRECFNTEMRVMNEERRRLLNHK